MRPPRGFRIHLRFLLSLLSLATLATTASADSFRWLEQGSSSQTVAWVQKQNERATAILGALPSRELWRNRLRALSQRTEVSVSRWGGKRTFYLKRLADHDRQILFWKQGDKERILLDSNRLASDASLGLWMPSPDGRYLAYSVHPRHKDEGTLAVREVVSGKENPVDQLPWESYGDLAWSADSRGFYYLAVSTALPASERVAAATLRYHTLGQSPSRDAWVYGPTGDSSRYLAPHLSEGGRWLIVETAHGFAGTTLVARDLQAATTGFQTIFDDPSTSATVSVSGDQFFLLTHDSAPYGKIRMSSRTVQGVWQWQTIVPERSGVDITELLLVQDALVLRTLSAATHGLEIRTRDGALVSSVALPIVGQISDLEGRADSPVFSFHLESFILPPTVCTASANTGVAACGNAFSINPMSEFVIETLHVPSADGTDIPMMLIHTPGYVATQAGYVWMQVYGGFGVPMTPRYSDAMISWLRAGGMVAIPYLRGGGEFGQAWHDAARGIRKQKTFDDTIAAAQFLVRKGYASGARIAIQGGSNGGLTACAAMTQRPDLFGAVIVKNPLTDMERYTLFGEGPAWISEYGSPNNPQERQALAAYSPYKRLRVGTSYPATLVLAGDSDDRVDPLHARKFAAALQSATSKPKGVFFKSLHQTGHRSSDSQQDHIDEWADRLAFMQWALGMP